MMKKYSLIIASSLLFNPFILSALPQEGLVTQKEEPKIFVNNRILAKVNGKSLSTYDVMKRLNILFYKDFPQYATSTVARYQYYQVNWKHILEEMVNKELITADASESKVEISSGDVRQEMERLFGPNIIANLDKVGMSFDEASKIVQNDLIIRRMLGGRVHSKSMRLLTPAKVKLKYEEFIANPENARPTQWKYQTLTIRDRTPQKAEALADKAYRLLIEEGTPLDKVIDTLKERQLIGRKAKATLSEEIVNNEKELSDAYKEILEGMDTGMYSQPTAHKSRTERTTVYRIFYVKEKTPGGMPSFKEMEPKLKDAVLGEIIEQETDLYLKKLRQHFHVQESDLNAMIPPDYQPFALR